MQQEKVLQMVLMVQMVQMVLMVQMVQILQAVLGQQQKYSSLVSPE